MVTIWLLCSCCVPIPFPYPILIHAYDVLNVSCFLWSRTLEHGRAGLSQAGALHGLGVWGRVATPGRCGVEGIPDVADRARG